MQCEKYKQEREGEKAKRISKITFRLATWRAQLRKWVNIGSETSIWRPKSSPNASQRVPRRPFEKHFGTIWASKLKSRSRCWLTFWAELFKLQTWTLFSMFASPSLLLSPLFALLTLHLSSWLFCQVFWDTRWFHTCPPNERERESKGDRDPMQFQRNAEHPKKGRRDSRSDNN